MKNLPTLFVSHGSPMLSLEDGPARRFLSSWTAQHARPSAILVASAHWETRGGVAVSTAEQPHTIHDFGGFPRELYALQYAAPGAPGLARQTIALLQQAGFAVSPSDSRGLDHGAWVPLRLMYPDADIPVVPLSIQSHGGAAGAWRLGRALAPLAADGLLVLASGNVTHNL